MPTAQKFEAHVAVVDRSVQKETVATGVALTAWEYTRPIPPAEKTCT
jgi:hypothetical protein